MAMVEALPGLLLGVVFVAGIFMAAYLGFARVWLQYQSEQALYCLSERTPVAICRQRLQKRVSTALPWGQLRILTLHGRPLATGRGEFWKVDLQWLIKDYGLRITRELDSKRLARKAALRW